MSYAPRSLSYLDGVEHERRRILDLLMSKKHYGYHDMHDTQTIYKFTDLLEAIEGADNDN